MRAAIATIFVLVIVGSASSGVVLGIDANPSADRAIQWTSSHPIVAIEDASVGVDQSTSVRLSLSKAPNGLSGFEINVSVSDPGVVQITNWSYPSEFGLADTQRSADNSTVNLKAIDLQENIQAGATDITLASVELTGIGGGQAAITVTVLQIDDDDGNPIETRVSNGSADVEGSDDTTATSTPTPTATATPSPTASPTAAPTATATPAPTTAEPTATAGSPSPSATRSPTSTKSPTPTDTTPTVVPGTTDSETRTRTGTTDQPEDGTLIPTPSASPTVREALTTTGQPGFGVALTVGTFLVWTVVAAYRR